MTLLDTNICVRFLRGDKSVIRRLIDADENDDLRIPAMVEGELFYGVEKSEHRDENREKVKGIVITHGHEDHIGGLAYLLQKIRVPVYATRLTAGLIEGKLEEHGLSGKVELNTATAGDIIRLGNFSVEFIHVNHSIPDSVAVAITTPIGTVIHTGDYKIDVTPISGKMIDLVRFGQLGNEGVLALMGESTNVEVRGHSDSESKVGESFDKLFMGCDKRIIITTFASNVHRLQQIIDVAVKYGRKVAVTVRSMENVLRVSMVLGYMNIPEGVLMDLDQINKLPRNKVVIISTGSQGEAMSALYRMAFSGHKQIQVDSGDRVIISASAIPGNENMISRVIDELFHKGAEVIYDRHTDLHVSGHACQEEQKMLLALVKPKFFIPVHGEYRMLMKHAELGRIMGVQPKNIVIAENGRVIELTKKSIRAEESVQSGAVLVDGSIGEVGSVVMRDRHKLAEDGMIVVVLPFSSYDHKLLADPEIVTRGFIYVKEAEELMEELKRVTLETVEACEAQRIMDWTTIKSKIKTNLSGYLYKTTRRSPMILPVISEI